MKDQPPPKPSAISRRAFIQGGATLVSSLPLVGCEPETPPASQLEPASPRRPVPLSASATELDITLDVNGQTRALHVEARTTLTQALRDPLGLTGTKLGCDHGNCGACTVLLDGLPVFSCATLAVEADGHEITTIEGLAEGDALHPLQEAFIEQDAIQCGFCTSGMILAASGIAESGSSPTEEEIREAVSGNLCRCGNYPQIFRAITQASGGSI